MAIFQARILEWVARPSLQGIFLTQGLNPGLPHGKDSDAGRDWGKEKKGTTEDEMAGWHH